MQNTEDNEANEPAAEYKSKQVHIFNSFEEQEAYELKKMAAIKFNRNFAAVTSLYYDCLCYAWVQPE